MAFQQPSCRAAVSRLPVSDLARTHEFYVCSFGFSPRYRFGGKSGVGLGEIYLRFCEAEPDKHEHLTIYFEISNSDQLFERYNAAAVEVRFPLTISPGAAGISESMTRTGIGWCLGTFGTKAI